MRSRYINYMAVFLFFVLSGQLFAENFGTIILAMYKSSDGYSESKNPIKWFFEPEIKKLGLKIEYHDFDKGLPNLSSLKGTRAILTWYNSSVVKDKDTGIKYTAFLTKAVDDGIKLVILKSFGAYGYKDGNETKWDIQHINPLFIKMGFNFKGFWTDDPKKLKIVYADRGMVEKDAKQDVSISRHYQQIIPIRDDVTAYLKIKRLDYIKGIGNGESSVILASKNGGFALEQYVIRGDKIMLNPSSFLQSTLFYNDNIQNVGIIIGDIKNKDRAIYNISYACKYAKIDSSFIEISKLNNMIPNDLYQYEVLLLALENTDEVPASLIKEYVNNGGNLIFLRYAVLNNDFMELLGVREYSNKNIDYFKEGFEIKPDFFMNNIELSCTDVDLNVRKTDLKSGRVIAAVNDAEKGKKFPILWEKSYGKGRILYWNTNLLLEGKRFRGTIIQSIHYLYDDFVSGVVNIAMIMIDDFPAPWWNVNYKEYREKYYADLLSKETDQMNRERLNTIIKNLENYKDISDTKFIREIWIKDILSFQKKFGLQYSCYLIFNYSKDTGIESNENEFAVRDFYLAADSLPITMGRIAVKNGWEMGLHGYNHQSLTLKRPEQYASEPWLNKEAMIKALKVAHKELENLYSSYMLPFSYVAPHNIIDAAGISALGEVFPSIRVLCTVYVGKQGENEQEFEWTDDYRFFQMPRLSSGYYMNNADRLTFYDGIHHFGIISHFIHPDDVFDEHRSSKFSGWTWMKAEFEKELAHIKKNFPWIRWMSAKDAFNEFQFYYNTNMRVKRTGKTIQIESSDGSDKYLFFRLKLKKGQKIKKTENCKVVSADYKSGDIILKTNEHKSMILLH